MDYEILVRMAASEIARKSESMLKAREDSGIGETLADFHNVWTKP